MAIEFSCPHCGKVLKTKEDKAGLAAKCPDCGGTVTVPDSAGTAADPWADATVIPPPSEADNEAPADPTDPDIGAEMKACPMCGKSIRAAARICRYCGEKLRGGTNQSTGVVPTPVGLSTALNTSFEIFKIHWLNLSLGALITLGIPMVVGWVLGFASQIAMAAVQGNGPPNNAILAMFVGAQFGLNIVQTLVQLYFQMGMYVMVLRVARGQEPNVGDCFQGGRFFLRGVVVQLLVTLAVVAILLVCAIPVGMVYLISKDETATLLATLVCALIAVVPLVILSLRIAPAHLYIVDQDVGPIEALKGAWSLSAPNVGTLFVTVILMSFVGGMGIFACCIGLFVTMGLFFITQAVTYHMMCGREITIADV